jgi:hypothetical protein
MRALRTAPASITTTIASIASRVAWGGATVTGRTLGRTMVTLALGDRGARRHRVLRRCQPERRVEDRPGRPPSYGRARPALSRHPPRRGRLDRWRARCLRRAGRAVDQDIVALAAGRTGKRDPNGQCGPFSGARRHRPGLARDCRSAGTQDPSHGHACGWSDACSRRQEPRGDDRAAKRHHGTQWPCWHVRPIWTSTRGLRRGVQRNQLGAAQRFAHKPVAGGATRLPVGHVTGP